jgi:hypothetical protein
MTLLGRIFSEKDQSGLLCMWGRIFLVDGRERVGEGMSPSQETMSGR